ncbi:MAG: 3-deoxy-manno-octulosonate cytidylyltransferase [Hylemonella sp.]|nr:3-deoxy-manno-octulosonate cytidylyltransferase [Hylemonella sp.]
MSYTILIPARLASTRLPNKPLADICGVPMVVRVAQRVQGVNGPSGAARVVVAADSQAIMDACGSHGIESVLTRLDHPSGSDRLAEACELLHLPDGDIVVNVQGDEPLIDPLLPEAVADLLVRRADLSMSTAAHAIGDVADYLNPNVVKVVLDATQRALYFSRAPIPWWRDGADNGAMALPSPAPLRHMGLYGYRVAFLRRFPKLTPAPMEITEALEQLRALWHGHQIAVHVTEQAPGHGVDTPDDLQRVRALFAAASNS